MRNRLAAAPGEVSFRSPRLAIPDLHLFASASLNGGMNSQADPVDIQDNQVIIAQNARCRYDVITRRTGFEKFIPTFDSADALPVLALKAFKQFDEQIKFLRFTRNTVRVHSSVLWSNVVPAVALTATDINKITFLSVNNQAFFGNECDPLQKINVAGLTCAAAGNAPIYKYYCAIANRIVGANRVGGSPSGVEVGWSGDFNFEQWDPLVDFSAGRVPLIDNSSEYADFITGLFSFSDVMIVMRERSIIAATLQPVASNPFYFSIAVPSIGCDTPSSIAQIPNGLIWYDRRLNNVFLYEHGKPPVALGNPIRAFLKHNIPDTARVISAYDPVNNEYLLGAVVSWTTLVKVWRFNLDTQAWTYDYFNNVVSLNPIDFRTSTTTIDDLVGTIDSLVGLIDDVTPSVTDPALFLGLAGGDILKSNTQLEKDDNQTYDFDVTSKVFKLNPNDSFVTQLHIEYIPIIGPGSFYIEYTKNGGDTWNTYKQVRWTVNDQGKRLTAVCNKNVRASTYQWRVVSNSGIFDIVEYAAYAYASDAFTRTKST
jgi:hypothetical protein